VGDIPWVERLSPNFYPGRTETRNIFIHATRGPGDRTLQAEYEAAVNYMLRPGTVSAHYVVGPAEVTRLVNTDDSARPAEENNRRSLSIEVAQPASQPPFTDFQVRAAAEIAARWCFWYGIPVRWVFSQSDPGIIGHEDSEQGQRSGKSDPGPQWPWPRFMQVVAGYVQLLEEDMALTDAQKAEVAANYDVIWGRLNELEPVVKPEIVGEMRSALINSKRVVGIP